MGPWGYLNEAVAANTAALTTKAVAKALRPDSRGVTFIERIAAKAKAGT